MNLKDKIVVITGGTKGLGLALAQVMQRRGALVVISSRSAAGVKVPIGMLAIPGDVTKEKEMLELAQKAKARFGRIDLWINNAGIWMPQASVRKLDLKRVRDMLEVNLFGVINGARAALSQMEAQGGGTIMNILSASAFQGVAKSSGYVASKYAARGFCESLRQEIGDSGIRVINVYPAGIKTAVFSGQFPAGYDKYMDPMEVAHRIAMNLEEAKPEEELVIKNI